MNNKKHIVIIHPDSTAMGAVANVVRHYAKELSKEFRVTIMSSSFPVDNENNVAFLETKSGNFRWLGRFSHVLRECYFARKALSKLKRLHGDNPIDIIICHAHALSALAARPMKKEFGIPSVMVTHGDIFDRPKGTYDPRLTWFYKKVTPIAYHHADLVIALSPYMKELAIRGGADADHIEVIPNGIDPEEIGLSGDVLPPQVSVDFPKLELLYVGRLSVEKGIDILIDACGLLKKDGVKFRLRIAGNGPLEASIEERIKILDIEGHIEFLAHVRRSELGRLYRSAHVLCVPSRSDSLPTVVLEALVTGTPVLGAKVGGIPFMIEDGVTGLLCLPNSDDSLMDAIRSFIHVPNNLHSMRISCRDVGINRFSWKSTGQQLTDTLRTLAM